MSVGSIATNAHHAMQARMQAATEAGESPGVPDHDNDGDEGGTRSAQVSASSGPRVNASGQTIGRHINVTA